MNLVNFRATRRRQTRLCPFFVILRRDESIARDMVFPKSDPILLSTRRSERWRLPSETSLGIGKYGEDEPR